MDSCISVENVIEDGFWSPKIHMLAQEVIPYQWRILNDQIPDATPSHSVENFRVAAKESKSPYYGKVFQDSDIAKWIEAASYSLKYHDSPEVRKNLKDVIGIIGRAQQADGYLDTYYTVKEPGKRWTNLTNGHELYCAGHMLEAAVAYKIATGDDSLLCIMSREVDCIRSVFGTEPGKIDSYPGHPEIELALMRAYEITGEEKYYELASFFVENRGRGKGFTQEEAYHEKLAAEPTRDLGYYQASQPIREQREATGHAVRVAYYFDGVAKVAQKNHDETLFSALRTLWNDVTERKMYLTGAIGAEAVGERFGAAYDLPSDTAYAETCASVGLMRWAHDMSVLEHDSCYADVLERVMYNALPASVSSDGRRYFYVNPLEMEPAIVKTRSDHFHVDAVRQKWFGCACCPPNAVRTIESLDMFQFVQEEEMVYMDLYLGCHAVFSDGLELAVQSRMPWEGKVRCTVLGSSPARLAFRIPRYSDSFEIVKGQQTVPYHVRGGYAMLDRKPSVGDVFDISFPFSPLFVVANSNVDELGGQVAVQCGPLVYCAEAIDNFPHLSQFKADANIPIAEREEEGKTLLVVYGTVPESKDTPLYYSMSQMKRMPSSVTMIPYYNWGNRGETEMRVWLHA